MNALPVPPVGAVAVKVALSPPSNGFAGAMIATDGRGLSVTVFVAVTGDAPTLSVTVTSYVSVVEEAVEGRVTAQVWLVHAPNEAPPGPFQEYSNGDVPPDTLAVSAVLRPLSVSAGFEERVTVGRGLSIMMLFAGEEVIPELSVTATV